MTKNSHINLDTHIPIFEHGGICRLIEKERKLERLTEREIWIIKQRLGICCPRATLAECGQTLGITRERVRTLEKRALRQIGIIKKQSINLSLEKIKS